MERKTLLRILLAIIIIAVIVWVGISYRDQLNLQNIQTTVQGFGMWAPVIFILIYIVATVAFLPGLIVTLAGGLLFGPIWGVVYNLIGAVIGASIAFLISRYLASDWVANKTGGRLKKLIDGVNNEGWRFVAIVRLVPVLPFNLLNYALGLTRIPAWEYIIASAVFMLPGTIAYTYVGSLGEAFIQGGGTQLVTKIAIGVGLLVIVGLIPYFVKKYMRRA